MPDFITLSCPSCGAQLQITNDIERFACSHCGQEHIIRRGGGVISLSPVVGAINDVRTGVDRTAAELSIIRLQKEIADLYDKKKEFVKQNPKPKISFWVAVALIPGIVITMVGICTIISIPENRDLSNYSILFICGLLPTFVVGLLVFYLRRRNMKYWKESLLNNLYPLNEQIAKKQDQLKRAQELVSQ